MSDRRWRKGDLVLHRADAKHPKMLMRVVGYTRDGLCRTVYHHTLLLGKKIHNKTAEYRNDTGHLLDPRDFGIKPYIHPDSFELARLWNFYWPVGTPVMLTKDDGSVVETRTVSKAVPEAYDDATILLEGLSGRWLLSRVTPVGG